VAPRGHRFEKHDTERLAAQEGREDEVAPQERVERRVGVRLPKPVDVPTHYGGARRSAATADDLELRVALDSGPRVEQDLETLRGSCRPMNNTDGLDESLRLRPPRPVDPRSHSTKRVRGAGQLPPPYRGPIPRPATRNVSSIINDRSAGRSHWYDPSTTRERAPSGR